MTRFGGHDGLDGAFFGFSGGLEPSRELIGKLFQFVTTFGSEEDGIGDRSARGLRRFALI